MSIMTSINAALQELGKDIHGENNNASSSGPNNYNIQDGTRNIEIIYDLENNKRKPYKNQTHDVPTKNTINEKEGKNGIVKGTEDLEK